MQGLGCPDRSGVSKEAKNVSWSLWVPKGLSGSFRPSSLWARQMGSMMREAVASAKNSLSLP